MGECTSLKLHIQVQLACVGNKVRGSLPLITSAAAAAVGCWLLLLLVVVDDDGDVSVCKLVLFCFVYSSMGRIHGLLVYRAGFVVGFL